MIGYLVIVQRTDLRPVGYLKRFSHLSGYLHWSRGADRWCLTDPRAVARGVLPKVFDAISDALRAFDSYRRDWAKAGCVCAMKLCTADAVFGIGQGAAGPGAGAAPADRPAGAPVGVLVTTPTKSHECDLRLVTSPTNSNESEFLAEDKSDSQRRSTNRHERHLGLEKYIARSPC